jgi:hypothetical protein
MYAEDLSAYSTGAARRALSRWQRDLVSGKAPTAHLNAARWRSSAVGPVIEDLVIAELQKRRAVGLPLGNADLIRFVTAKLHEHGKQNLLKEYGGKLVLSPSWCSRFWRRHSYVVRLSATKTTPVPEDYAAKRGDFIRIGGAIIRDHNIIDELIFNVDETGVLFAPVKNRTRALRGETRVQIIGIGHKPGLTITLCVSAAGAVYGPQYIFEVSIVIYM